MTDGTDPDWQLLPEQPLAFFGLQPGFDPLELRRRYNALLRRFKPDRAPREFKLLRAAYEALSEPQVGPRWSYWSFADSPPTEPAAQPAPTAPAPSDPQPDPAPTDLWARVAALRSAVLTDDLAVVRSRWRALQADAVAAREAGADDELTLVELLVEYREQRQALLREVSPSLPMFTALDDAIAAIAGGRSDRIASAKRQLCAAGRQAIADAATLLPVAHPALTAAIAILRLDRQGDPLRSRPGLQQRIQAGQLIERVAAATDRDLRGFLWFRLPVITAGLSVIGFAVWIYLVLGRGWKFLTTTSGGAGPATWPLLVRPCAWLGILLGLAFSFGHWEAPIGRRVARRLYARHWRGLVLLHLMDQGGTVDELLAALRAARAQDAAASYQQRHLLKLVEHDAGLTITASACAGARADGPA